MTITVKRGSRTYRLLTETTLYSTTDLDRARRSRFAYRLDGDTARLSLLGFLHGLVGLTLWVEEA